MTGGGGLVLVATPIGNLGDLSPRAREALAAADLLCCEDTRRTRVLLSAAGVPAGRRLVSLHAHNEAARIPEVLGALASGRQIALVSDAGMPAVSDPGERLVAAAVAAGVPVTVVPGPSAALSALVVSGLPTARFAFEGFLPRAGAARQRRLDALVGDERTTVVYEAPGRVAATLAQLAARAPGRAVAVCRELTKVHEEVWHGTLAAAATHFSAAGVRGEVVIVVGGTPPIAAAPPDDDAVTAALASALEAGHSTRDAAAAVAAELGVPRRRAYALCVALQGAGAAGADRRNRRVR